MTIFSKDINQPNTFFTHYMYPSRALMTIYSKDISHNPRHSLYIIYPSVTLMVSGLQDLTASTMSSKSLYITLSAPSTAAGGGE